MENRKFDVAIIGGGPAGLTAGIYASRGGFSVALFEGTTVGGQITQSEKVDNYPAIPSVSGYELAVKMQEHAQKSGVNFLYETVVSLVLDENPKKIVTANGTITAKTVILCMGASHKKLGLDAEERLTGSGVSYCATCDGAFFRNKTVAVNGGGNTAVQDALYLERFASKVYLIHRREQLRASAPLAEKVKNSGVEIIWNTTVCGLIGESKLTALNLKNAVTGETSTLDVNGLFVAVGQIPNSQLTDVNKDEKGYILTDEKMATSTSGVFAAGDVRSKTLRQVVTACSDGAIAADSAGEWLNSNR